MNLVPVVMRLKNCQSDYKPFSLTHIDLMTFWCCSMIDLIVKTTMIPDNDALLTHTHSCRGDPQRRHQVTNTNGLMKDVLVWKLQI